MDCVNCDRKADWVYLNEKGFAIGLCTQCKEAFELGQGNPKVGLETIEAFSERIRVKGGQGGDQARKRQR
jgi:hypothetical protein